MQSSPSQPMNSFVVAGAFLLTNNPADPFPQSEIWVENGRIKAIAKTVNAPASVRRLQLPGQVIIPGFVQTHIHLCQTLFRNLADDLELLDWLSQKIWPFEGAHDPASLRVSAELGIYELLASGTTTVLDMGTVRHTEVIFEAAERLGIRAFIGKCLMDRPDMPKELRENTAVALKENLILSEHWHGRASGRLHYAHAPRFALSCTETLLQNVREQAQAKAQIVHTHSSENQQEIAAVRQLYGCENIEFFERIGLAGPSLVLAHCIHLSEKEKNILAGKQIKVSHCPSSNLKLASGIAPIIDLQKRGICVSLGADGAPCNNNLNMFQEMRLASLLQKPAHGPRALAAAEAFAMATLAGAKALGLEAEIGSLEQGKKADMVALKLQSPETLVDLKAGQPSAALSAIVYSAGPQNVSHTWVEGRLVYERAASPAESLFRNAIEKQREVLARLDTRLAQR